MTTYAKLRESAEIGVAGRAHTKHNGIIVLKDKFYECYQPDELDNEEFNTFIIVPEYEPTHIYQVRSIDFEFVQGWEIGKEPPVCPDCGMELDEVMQLVEAVAYFDGRDGIYQEGEDFRVKTLCPHCAYALNELFPRGATAWRAPING